MLGLRVCVTKTVTEKQQERTFQDLTVKPQIQKDAGTGSKTEQASSCLDGAGHHLSMELAASHV